MTRVDTHLHVWRAAEGQTPGVSTIVPPQTDVPIELAEETLRSHAIDRAVLVQPVFRGEDNRYVADCARAQPQRFAAVCVVDPRTPGAEARLDHWVGLGCRGLRLRPRIAGEGPIFGDPTTWPLWAAAERLGVVVSLLSGPEHVPAICALAERFAGVRIVIDHLGHPDVAEGASGAGFRALLALARCENVSIKTSGFYHFSREVFPYADCFELIRAVCEHFGPGRMLWGSDFPHVVPSCGYQRALELPAAALKHLPDRDHQQIMGASAISLYWPP